MTPRLPKAPFIRTSLLCLTAVAGLTVSTLIRALRIPQVEAAPTTTDAELVRATSSPPLPEVDVEAVGENDIFQPDRKGLPMRYRMPGESGPATATPGPDPAKPIVLGTVLATDGAHFATCQLPGGRPVIVHVGDRLGEYVVVSIERNRVVFKAAGRARLEIAPVRPGAPTDIAPFDNNNSAINTNGPALTNRFLQRAARKFTKPPAS